MKKKEHKRTSCPCSAFVDFQPCQNETAFWFSRTITSICGANTAPQEGEDLWHAVSVMPFIQKQPEKKKRDIIQFYQFHPRFLPPPPRSHFVPAFLSLPLVSRSLSNVSPSCVLFPSAVRGTAPAARNTNCSLMLCLCFFPVSCGSLGP